MCIRVFLAQPVDGLPRGQLVARVRMVQRLLEGLPAEIVAPYLDDEEHLNGRVTRAGARSILEKDYEMVSGCDVFVADMSDDTRPAIGMLLEMACAARHGIKVIVRTGKSRIGDRVFIRALADHLCETWEEVRERLLSCHPICTEATAQHESATSTRS
jgi:hypothetical protein